MKKIGIMGAQGTGKTTLMLKIASGIKSENPALTVNILPEVARKSPGKINKQSSEKNQIWIHLMQHCTEIEIEMNSDVIVCDRTVLDSLVYAKVQGYHDLVQRYFMNALNWMDTYDTLYCWRWN